ncbi:MAG: hypothetical protein RMM30_10285 [Armatimonadota bacterium]|nr:hypothetical protein [Armatimonadota bacterium]MDW8156954.1 hypothetical protein [Armatimonadota bacterium]
MGLRRLVSFLYWLARVLRDVEVLASGDPRKIVRRARNKVLGRWMGRLFRL